MSRNSPLLRRTITIGVAVPFSRLNHSSIRFCVILGVGSDVKPLSRIPVNSISKTLAKS